MGSRAGANVLLAMIACGVGVACGTSSSHPTFTVPDAGPSSSDAGSSEDDQRVDAGPCGELTSFDDIIFVAPASSVKSNAIRGVDSSYCGAAVQGWNESSDGWSGPCATVAHALKHVGAKKVLVAAGTYDERDNFAVLRGGVLIEGGWDASEVAVDVSCDHWACAGRYEPHWRKSCGGSTAAEPATKIASSAGFEAKELGGTATLVDLSIHFSAGPGSGPNRIGVRAVGASTLIELIDVWLDSGAASSGGYAATGTPGAVGAGDCTAADAGAGATVGTSGSDSNGGIFSSDGYHPGSGTPGGPGVGGAAGLPGGDATCVECVTQCSTSTPCSIATKLRQCGSQGAPGCGGGGGAGGEGGRGGGSSVGIYAWGAHVNVTRGGVSAGAGGNGSGGGAGGAGGLGSTGSSGSPAPSIPCSTSCDFVLGACTGTTPAQAQGGLGSTGGSGSAGGPGGGGEGGSSYAIVQGGGAVVTYGPDTAIHHGAPGKGRGTAPDGTAGDVLTLP